MDWKFVGLAVACVILCLLAGAIGSYFTMPSIPAWYAGLEKPFFSPPNWVFGPVWTLLYVLMGVSLALVLRKGLKNWKVKVCAELFAIQLLLNTAWSLVFFGLHAPFFGFFVLALLWATLLFTIWKFFEVSRPAGWLLVPYILWVSFAGILNLSVALLN